MLKQTVPFNTYGWLTPARQLELHSLLVKMHGIVGASVSEKLSVIFSYALLKCFLIYGNNTRAYRVLW